MNIDKIIVTICVILAIVTFVLMLITAGIEKDDDKIIIEYTDLAEVPVQPVKIEEKYYGMIYNLSQGYIPYPSQEKDLLSNVTYLDARNTLLFINDGENRSDIKEFQALGYLNELYATEAVPNVSRIWNEPFH